MKPEEQAIKIWNDTIKNPLSFEVAIDNAVEELFQKNFSLEEVPVVLKKHIKDFLAQKFTPFMSGDGSVVDSTAQAIWAKVMGLK